MSNPIESNTSLTLNIPLLVPIDEIKFQQAKLDWESNATLEDLNTLKFKGETFNTIISAIRNQSKSDLDIAKLENLVNQIVEIDNFIKR